MTSTEFQGKRTYVYLNTSNQDIGATFKTHVDTTKLMGTFDDIKPAGGDQPIEHKTTVGGSKIKVETEQNDFTISGKIYAKTDDPLYFKRLLYGGASGAPVDASGTATDISIFIESEEGTSKSQMFLLNTNVTKIEDDITGSDVVSASFEAVCSPVASDGTINVKYGSHKTGEDLTA